MINTSPVVTVKIKLASVCFMTTHNNQIVDMYIGKAKSSLHIFIQLPGGGKNDNTFGKMAHNRKGKASPRPKNWNVSSAVSGGCEKAKPIAVAMNGAVQGVATKTANVPVKKLLKMLLIPGILTVKFGIEKKLEKLSPTRNNKYVNNITNIGDCKL